MAFVFWLMLFASPVILKLAGVAALATVPMWVAAIPIGAMLVYCAVIFLFYVIGVIFAWKLFSR